MADRKRKKGIPKIFIITSALTLLITLAFFTPQAIFQVQDAILCRNTVLSRQESLNVEALSTTYERSLTERMTNYAQGLAEDETFYVTSQNLALNEELNHYLYSNDCFYGEFMNSLFDSGLLSMGLWEMEYSVSQWKQYVIYSDDFTKGVNFILWYIELQDSEGGFFRILADAEDGTIYAVKKEGNRELGEARARKMRNQMGYDILQDGIATRLWGFCAIYYGALDDDEEKNFYIMVEELGWQGSMLGPAVWPETDEQSMVMDALDNHESLRGLQEKVRYYMDGDTSIAFILPYGDFSVEAFMELPALEEQSLDSYGYPDVTIGISRICEMIPEFA